MKLSEINIRDPFILPENGKYYMYGTRGAGCWAGEKAPNMGFDVYISTDLENWSEPQEVFSASDDFWATHNFWAPEVHKYNDKFYMFASFKNADRNRGTQILVADTPDGKFKPISDYPVTPEEWMSLDGTLYIDTNGAPHIVFCHEHCQIKNGTVCELQLSDDLSKAVSEPRTLFAGSDPWWARKEHNNWVTDGPFLYRGESGRLYMIWSSFTDSGYVQAVSYSDNGDISGNWKHDLPLLAEKDGGHGMIFKGFDGKLYLILHRPNNNPMERPVLTEICEVDGHLETKQ
ncbi:MAG: family 43 glycosylhydrolase [Clostridia bacterium]|nr:family 43 glycosylhydrolase [Clostridia bacterium]